MQRLGKSLRSIPIVLILWCANVVAQVSVNIGSGMNVSAVGGVRITFDKDWNNNGTFTGALATTRTVGMGSSTFGGIGVVLNSGADDIGDVTVIRVSGPEGAITVGGNTGINRSWTITSDNPPSSGRLLTLSWNSDDDSGDMTTAQVWKSTDGGTTWFPVGSPDDVIGSDPRFISVDITSFSDWTVSGSDNPLPVIIGEPGLPRTMALSQNYPNPFNPTTILEYELPKAMEMELAIYNLQGQKVRVLVHKKQNVGYYIVKWDGRDDQGVSVAAGIYFYRLFTSEFVRTRKMTLLK